MVLTVLVRELEHYRRVEPIGYQWSVLWKSYGAGDHFWVWRPLLLPRNVIVSLRGCSNNQRTDITGAMTQSQIPRLYEQRARSAECLLGPGCRAEGGRCRPKPWTPEWIIESTYHSRIWVAVRGEKEWGDQGLQGAFKRRQPQFKIDTPSLWVSQWLTKGKRNMINY